MSNISVVISAFNEEKLLGDCLTSLEGLDAEIIVIDNTSHDKTKQIATKYTKHVYTLVNDPVMLNKNKNIGFGKATKEWTLSLDADERLTPELIGEIKRAIKNNKNNGYELPRKNIIFGKWIQNAIWWPDYNLRLFRTGQGKFPEKHVHEKLEVRGKIEKLDSPMIHLNYQTISQFIKKLDNTYTESEAENFIKSSKNIQWYDAIRFPTNDFLKNFFALNGYKDGMHGLVLSMLQAFYAFVVFAKIWEKKENFKDITPDNFLKSFLKEVSKISKDARYWIFTSLMNESRSSKLLFKVRRKLGR